MNLIAAGLLVLTITFYTGQTFGNKMFAVNYRGPESAVTPVFSVIYGLVVAAATLIYNGFGFSASLSTVLFGCLNGVVLFLYNLSSIKASRSGPYAFQSLVTQFGGIVLVLLAESLLWQVQITVLQYIGIFLMLLSFVLFNLKGLSLKSALKGYYPAIIGVFMTNGIYGVVMNSQQRMNLNTQRNEMIMVTFLVSALISLAFLLASQKSVSASISTFKMAPKTLFFAFLSSIAAAIAINVMLLAMRYVPASILYSINNGGIVIVSEILSNRVLKERMDRYMISGIAVAVVSIALMSI